MQAEQAQYLAVLIIGSLTGILIFQGNLLLVIRERTTYPPLLLFIALAACFDIVGIQSKWWIFSSTKLLGINILMVPIEEYFLFLSAFLMTAAAWHFFGEQTKPASS